MNFKNINSFPFQKVLLLIVLLTGSLFAVNAQVAMKKSWTIVIDAGHGGNDGGASGVYSKEKNVALKTALALGKAIEEQLPDVNVVYTRTTDVRIQLYDRIGLANRIKADLFISIHCNSLALRTQGRSTHMGTETLLSGSGRLGEQDVAIRENASILLEKDYKTNYEGFDPKDMTGSEAIQNQIILGMMKNIYRKQSINLASAFQDQYKQVGRISRGVREQSLAVLARAAMPAVLTEIGFISAPEEENYLNSAIGQQEIVSCILKGIQAYKLQSERAMIE